MISVSLLITKKLRSSSKLNYDNSKSLQTSDINIYLFLPSLLNPDAQKAFGSSHFVLSDSC